MTNEEAIRFASSLMDNLVVNDNDLETFCDVAIKALEKQIPKKPIIEGRRTTFYYVCPVCGMPISISKRCGNNDCGQAIYWSDDND